PRVTAATRNTATAAPSSPTAKRGVPHAPVAVLARVRWYRHAGWRVTRGSPQGASAGDWRAQRGACGTYQLRGAPEPRTRSPAGTPGSPATPARTGTEITARSTPTPRDSSTPQAR